MIEHFADKEVRKLFHGEKSRVPTDLQRRAWVMLERLENATSLDDLRNPPGNRLHQLKGKRKHQHAISINGNYRLCFDWNDGHPREVEIIDYH